MNCGIIFEEFFKTQFIHHLGSLGRTSNRSTNKDRLLWTRPASIGHVRITAFADTPSKIEFYSQWVKNAPTTLTSISPLAEPTLSKCNPSPSHDLRIAEDPAVIQHVSLIWFSHAVNEIHFSLFQRSGQLTHLIIDCRHVLAAETNGDNGFVPTRVEIRQDIVMIGHYGGPYATR